MTNLAKNPIKPLSLIYLDANATTQVLPQAAAAALSTMETLFGNPSSSHVTGLQAKQIVDKTRQQAKNIIGAGNGQVIFTSGATEGIQTAILSALINAKKMLNNTESESKDYCLLYGATEHKAVPESLKHWNEILEINAEIKAIPVDEMGQLDIDFIAKEVPNALMICTMAVNNETGVFQDISLLDETIRANNPTTAWMVDCVQALGKTSVDLAKTSIDYAPFSGHKLYAPKGIGFMYVKENAAFTPFIAGGGQESGLRSGTENLPGLAALSVIFSMLLSECETSFAPVETLHLFSQQIVSELTQSFP
jgi:cysteine sulfinate desulfinase/cysteine desulfurase-like protein